MLYGSSAAEQWPIDETEEAAPKRRCKPKFQQLPYSVIDDRRMSYRFRCFLGWHACHGVNWHSQKAVLKRETGAGKTRFWACIEEGKRLGYLEREQALARDGKPFPRAKERRNVKAAPEGKRDGYFLPVSEADLQGIAFREIGVLHYLRSHDFAYVQSAAHIAKQVNLNPQTVRSICKALITKGLAKLIEKPRDERGRITGEGYVATPWEPGAASAPCDKKPDTGKTGHRKTGTHILEQLSPSLRENNFHSRLSEKAEKSITSSPGAMTRKPFSSEGKGEGKADTYKARKAAKEQRDIEKLYKRTGIECPLKLPADDPLAGTPFDRPTTFEEAAKRVNEALEARATAGCEIEVDSLADLQFEDIGPDEIAETLCITDKALCQGILKAADGKVKKGLLGREGLLSARRMIARLMQEDMTAVQAFAFLFAEIEKATKHKGRWFNGWKLISKPIGGNLQTGGFDHAMTVEELRSLAEKFDAADENRVINRWLFGERGLAGLRKLIADYGGEAVNDAVMYVILGSKTEREIEPGHVRTWAYFDPRITQQSELEGFERL